MKKYFLALFLLTFIVPSIAFASWWNPFTWFQKQPQTEQTTPVVSNPVIIPTNANTPTITPKTVASSVKKVAKTDNQLCIEQFGLHTYSTGVKNAKGGLTCQCENNYTWTGKQCIFVQSNGCTSTTGYSPTTGASCNGETPPVLNTS